MKVLIIGAEGQLGTELCAAFKDQDLYRADLDGTSMHLDVCNADAVFRMICDEIRPDVVINTAAAHQVADCEQRPDIAFAVNATGAHQIARACAQNGSRMIHISTDYVFGNGAMRPRRETDLPAPLNVYGVSKLAGEHLVAAACADSCIVRTAALYGAAPCRAKAGRNFIGLMLHLARTKGQVAVVTDEFTSPTSTAALARQIRVIAEKAEPGLYHATCNGACSWYDFAQVIFELTQTPVDLQKATVAAFPAPVRRPHYAVLENAHLQALGLDIMPEWREALTDYLAECPPHAEC